MTDQCDNTYAKPGTTPEMIVAEIKRRAATYWRELYDSQTARRVIIRRESLRRAADRRARVKARRRAKGWPT